MTTSLTLRGAKGTALTHNEMDANLTNLRTTADAALAATDSLTADKAEAAALGVANTDQNMGSFAGTTITDNVSAKAAIQALETAVETKANASAVGVTASAANMGTFTGSTIPDSQTAKQALQALETETETKSTALGIAGGATNLGTFTGTTISDNGTVKAGMQELETAVELRTVAADLAATGGASLVGTIQSGAGAQSRNAQAKLNDVVSLTDFDTEAHAKTAANNLRAIVDATNGAIGFYDTSFSITKAQAKSSFKSFQTAGNGTPINVFQAMTINGTLISSTNSNFLATATPDNVTFSGWGLRGSGGTNPLVVSNFGGWIENNTALTWVQEIDVNNEGATQSEASDSGGVGIALNTGSTYSPDTALWVRRFTGAGSGPGFMRGVVIEGVRNTAIRVMAMDATTYPSLTPAAPGTVNVLVCGKSSDAQYRFRMDQNGGMYWGSGAAGSDVNLTRGSASLNCSGAFGATQYFVGANAVVGSRRTGWSTATGTATRTSFDTATVTLAQLAERVKALIDDLHGTAGHGLIGS